MSMIGAATFAGFIESLGFIPPKTIEPGRWMPFSTNGKHHDTAGRARLFPDGEGGIVHDWRSGESWSWQAKRERAFSPDEIRVWKEKIERNKREAEAERQREVQQTAERATTIWREAKPADDSHSYLKAKGVKSYGLRVYRGPLALNGLKLDGALVVPSRTVAGELVSLSFIQPEDKRYLSGAKRPGGYFGIGKPDGVLAIAEGYATGASIHAATGHAVAIAFDAANLLPVARELRGKFPDARLILCADDDSRSAGNPGITKATEAARAVGGLLAVPEFGDDRPEGATDFNDLAQHRGAEAVRTCVEGASAPKVSEAPLVAEDATAADVDDASGLSEPRIVALEIGALLMRDFPVKEPFLAPWLRRQDLAMVYAKRGVGKTHFCLALAYAVASGGSFLGWKAPTPRRVLYIDGEMPGATMKERLAALAGAQDAEPPEGFLRIVTPDAQPLPLPDLATRDGQEELAPVIEDAELIVLDNLSSLMRAGVENEGEAWVPMATWALARRREGRSVLFVHHAGKGGQQRGASRREDLLDVSMVLKHPSDYTPDQGARFEVIFEKARGLFGEDVQPMEARLEDVGGRQVWTSRKAEGATADRVAQLSALGMSAPEIANELQVHRSTVYRALEAIKAKGSGNGSS